MDASYELAGEIEAPRLPGRVVLRPSVDDALGAAAADLFLQAHACVRAFGAFHLGMGYGPVEHRLLVRLMTDPNYRDLPWSRTHLWSLVEPRVGVGDERHSHTHLGEMVLAATDMPEDQAHPLPGHLHDAVERYEAELLGHLGQRDAGQDRLDCVLLPPEPAVLRGTDDPMGRLVGSSEDGSVVTLTARALRGCRLLMVIGTGRGAMAMVRAAEADHASVGVLPVGGELRWYLDHRACGGDNREGPAEESV
ncbi:MAG: 6-phosphogluconolactonase [Phycisphaerales bacterium]|nr:6-phosphogluconolactonase [Planctomycetota bacterium]MCH8508748.1 6-phosphogluconolactonase [Phycisphaerales bacterium]